MSTKSRAKNPHDPAVKSFADHLGELRGRLAWTALVFLVSSALAYQFRDQLISFVLAPIGGQQLVYLTPAGGFAFIFQVTMYAGLLVTAPIAIYHLYRFLAPALPEHRRRTGLKIIFTSSFLMLVGASFGYFAAIPAALRFLTTFAGDFVQPNLTADSYLAFVTAYVLGLGLLFQLPLLLVILNWIRPFPPGGLWKSQQYVFVGAFVAAALITPTPDMLNQTMVALPIIGVYQFGVLAVYNTNRRQRKSRPVVEVSAVRRMTDVPVVLEFPEPPVPKPVVAQRVSKPQPMRPQRPVAVRPMVQPSRPVPQMSRPTRPLRNGRPVSIDGII